MRNFPRLITYFVGLLILSPVTFADQPAQAPANYNSQDLTLRFPQYEPGQVKTERVLTCGALEPKRPGVASRFQENKFVKYTLGASEQQKIIPVGTIATYDGVYAVTDSEGKLVRISQFDRKKTPPFAQGQVFHCLLELLNPDGTRSSILGFATVKSNASSISWKFENDGSSSTIIKY